MILPGWALLLDFLRMTPGPFPLTPLATIALRSVLLRIPTVLWAAAVNAALVSGAPAPGAKRLRLKMVTCFLAAVAITMTANLPLPGIRSCTGFSLIHFAGILYSSLRMFKGASVIRKCRKPFMILSTTVNL